MTALRKSAHGAVRRYTAPAAARRYAAPPEVFEYQADVTPEAVRAIQAKADEVLGNKDEWVVISGHVGAKR